MRALSEQERLRAGERIGGSTEWLGCGHHLARYAVRRRRLVELAEHRTLTGSIVARTRQYRSALSVLANKGGSLGSASPDCLSDAIRAREEAWAFWGGHITGSLTDEGHSITNAVCGRRFRNWPDHLSGSHHRDSWIRRLLLSHHILTIVRQFDGQYIKIWAQLPDMNSPSPWAGESIPTRTRRGCRRRDAPDRRRSRSSARCRLVLPDSHQPRVRPMPSGRIRQRLSDARHRASGRG